MYSTKQDNVTRLNVIHCVNLQLRFGKTLSQPTIEEILDEPIKEFVTTTTTMPTFVEQTPKAAQNKPDPPSSARAFDLPREEGGQSPTNLLKDPTPKEKIKAPFLKLMKPIIVKDTPKMTTSTEIALIQEIK